MAHPTRKAFILGAGLGTRLRPLTEKLPKPLVPFANRPMVEHVLDHCIAAGIEAFAINTHHCAEAWLEHFPEQSYRGCPITFYHEPVLLETGGGIKNIADWIDGEPLLVYNGDILTDIDIAALISQHSRTEDHATLALLAGGANCNVGIAGDRVTDIRYLRKIDPGTHQFSGIYIIQPDLLDLIPADTKVSIIPAFIVLAERQQLGAHFCEQASWQDLGTIEEYLRAHHALAQETGVEATSCSTANIHPDAQVDTKTCFLGANCVIEQGSKLSNSIVWPNAHVHAGAELYQCIVRYQAEGSHRMETL
ncbi:sugar phosphate nucleotidyltransferase [Rubritalea marina]|uniref:sugar phosphate nucleotidyltransferase n=1 Tax=Rubritalea marina TaxID=361055 RepID=UPI00037B7611|nr:sugar phosphate nucleotidyltransferase [Rubritalea marina]